MPRDWTVSVVVVNFNGQSHLDECLASVQDAEGTVEEIILVDDASTDGGVSLVEKKYPRVKIIRLTENSGPAAARNTGITAARGRWVCLIDNDVRVDRYWLVELLKAAGQYPGAALFSSMVAVYENPTLVGTEGLDLHFLGMPTFRKAGKNVSDSRGLKAREIGAAGGASLLIDKKNTGADLFDPDFFYGFEDTDACLGYRLAGGKCYVVPNSVVFHKFSTGGAEGLSDSEDRYSPARAFFVFRNRWWLILKYYRLNTIFALGPALLFFEVVCLIFAARRGVLWSYAAAAVSFLRTLPVILRKRRNVQKLRAIGDGELLSAHSLSPGSGSLRTSKEATGFAMADAFFKKYWMVCRKFVNG